jgi:hypothetical protein
MARGRRACRPRGAIEHCPPLGLASGPPAARTGRVRLCATRVKLRADEPKGDIALKEIRCAEAGFFPDWQGVMRGENEERVMAAAAEHGRNFHGMTDAKFTDENVEITRSHIRDV